ncbi:MAG: hypothetical protein AYK18_09535 [Theionarchaea archaeon DG-70]|nr:MAG: hypothetical protein AYK18_09535 [Theionarchaea archaeon DG-70]
MANIKKVNTLVICVLLVGSMIILNSREVAAQSISGTVYEDTNMNGVFDAGESVIPIATCNVVFLDYPAGPWTPIGALGSYNFGTSPGYHWVTVRVPGYKAVTKNVNVTGAMIVNFGLVPFESITGRAVKTDGTGIVGMHVEVWQMGTPLPMYDTLTDMFGNYCIHGLPPGMYDLHIQKAEYFDQWKFNISVDGMTINVGGTPCRYNWHTTSNVNFTNLSYDHGMIFGTVNLPGAVVEVPGLGLSTTCDSLGNYSIHNIPAGYYYVVAKKNGFQTGVEFICVTNGTTGPTGPIPFSLIPSTGLPIIEGSVADSMQAIENALVEIPGLGWSYGTGLEIYTDKAGYYIFADFAGSNTYAPHPLGPGKYTIVVRNEAGSVTDESDNHHKTNARTVMTQLGRVTVASFQLEENPGIKFGRVINTDGIGVEGATVYVPNSPYKTVTDSSGVFALELPSETYSEDCDTVILPYQTLRGFDEMNYCGMIDTFQTSYPGAPPVSYHRMHKARYVIKVERATYTFTMEYFIPVPGGPGLANPPDPCDLCMNGIILNYKTGILKGQVYDSTGMPVTNGFVFVVGRDVPLQANGWFETHDVPVGRYTAAVIDPTRTILGTETGIYVYYDQVTYKVINLGAPPTTNFISGFIYSNKVRLDASGDTLPDANGYSAGAAFDPGEGISGVTVETTATYSAVTDSYGFYCITGIPTTVGSTTIVATKTGYITIANPSVVPTSMLVFFPGFAGTAGATVSPMSRFRGSLSGRVTNEEGRDVSSVAANIWAPAQIADETDTNGFYIFADVEYGSYLIMVCGGGTCGIDYKVTFSKGSYAPVTVDGNVTKDITMEKTRGRVEGIVDDAATTSRLQDVMVKISGKYYSSTDMMGYYTVLNVPSGTHTAYAYSYGYQLQKHTGTDQSIGIVGGQLFTANFSLNAGLMSTGWIEGFITLELTDGFCDVVARLNPTFDQVTTDSEGYYLFTNVSPGTQYYVHGEIGDYMTVDPAGPIAVSGGTGAWAALVHMKRCTGTVDGYITDSHTTAPIVGATVILADMNRNDQVPLWYLPYPGYPGSDYYTDYERSKIYQTTTSTSAEPYTDSNFNGSYDPGEPFTDTNGNGKWDGVGYYMFTDVPWSDQASADPNKTWAWTVVVLKTGYAVGVNDAAVVCGSTSTVSFAVDPLCTIKGTATFDILCASSATVTATQIAGGTEGSTEFGWSSSGVATVMTSGGIYYIEHLHPGAYDVTAAAGSCSMTNPTTPYTGAYSIPANYRIITDLVDFTFGIVTGSGGTGSGEQGSGEEGAQGGEGEAEGGEQGSQESEESEESESEDSSSGGSSSDSDSDTSAAQQESQEEQGRSYPESKLLLEVAQDSIQHAKVLRNKAHDAVQNTDDVSENVIELLSQADEYLEKALELYGQGDYAEAILWAEKAIQYYQNVLELLT